MFAGGRDSSVPVPKCQRDITALVPNCQDTSAPVGWCRNVLGPKCPVLGPKCLDTKKDSSTLVPICPDTSAPV